MEFAHKFALRSAENSVIFDQHEKIFPFFIFAFFEILHLGTKLVKLLFVFVVDFALCFNTLRETILEPFVHKLSKTFIQVKMMQGEYSSKESFLLTLAFQLCCELVHGCEEGSVLLLDGIIECYL